MQILDDNDSGMVANGIVGKRRLSRQFSQFSQRSRLSSLVSEKEFVRAFSRQETIKDETEPPKATDNKNELKRLKEGQ